VQCPNWSVVWTPRGGDRFGLTFEEGRNTMETYFEWLESPAEEEVQVPDFENGIEEIEISNGEADEEES